MNEPLVLSLETATLAGSIAVVRGSRTLATRVGRPEVSHSNTLLTDIDEILSSLDLSVKDVDLFAVANGPGSFTGLRIGIATVKALSTTLSSPCIGVPTLEAIARSAGVRDSIVALLPAGRGEVFVQLFSTSQKEVMVLDKARHLSPDKAIETYIERPGICWVGDGAQLYSGLIETFAAKAGYKFLGSDNATIEPAAQSWVITRSASTLAESVASLGIARLGEGRVEMASTLKAIYVRPSDAELKH